MSSGWLVAGQQHQLLLLLLQEQSLLPMLVLVLVGYSVRRAA